MPNGWEEVKLDDLALYRRGSFPQPYGNPEWVDEVNGYPFIQVFDIDKNMKLKKATKTKISDAAINKSVFIQAGTVIVSLQGSIGRVAITQYDAYVDRTVLLFQSFKRKMDTIYFAYAIQELFEIEKEKAPGGTIKTITKQVLSNFTIKVPTHNEQHKIAKILSTWDKAITITEKLIETSKQQKKALMQQLLTGKKRLVNPETGKVFQGEWEEVKLIDTASSERYSFTGGPFGSDLKSSDYTESGVRIIQLQNIGEGCFHDSYKIFTSEEKADELYSCNIYPDDIIISKMGDPVARATLIPDYHCRYVMASDGIRLAVNKRKFDNRFILELINFDSFRNTALSKSTGSTRKRIGLTDLKNIKMSVPELTEQQKIASVLTVADKEIEVLEAKLAHFKQEKKALMQQLLTGKRRVKVDEMEVTI